MTEKDKANLFLASFKPSPTNAAASNAFVPASNEMPRLDPLTVDNKAEDSLSPTSTPDVDASSKKKEPRKSVVRRTLKSLLPGKHNKRVTVVAPTEATPLIDDKTKSIPETVVSNNNAQRRPGAMVWDGVHTDDENPHKIQLRQRAQQGWQRIAAEVRNGDMLLRAAAINPTRNKLSIDDKERKRQVAQEWIRNGVEFNLWQCLLAITFYIGVAIFAFSFVLAEWTLIDSIYFAIVTFTTIGYGDLVPDSYISRVFTCFFALSGVACLGIAIGVIGNNVVEAQEKAVEQTKKMAQSRVLNLFGSSIPRKSSRKLRVASVGEPSDSDEATAVSTLDSEDSNSEAPQPDSRKSSPLWQLFSRFSLVLVILVAFAICVASDPGIDGDKVDIFDALYYTIITASTVGYGDFAPKTQRGRLLAIFFIPLSVGAMGHYLSSVASVIMDSRRSSFQKQMDQHELSMQDLEIMDEDGDGLVTRAEYLEFMLVAMNKVDKDFIDEIRQSFARLDTDGTGTLSKEDMVAAARLKLRTPAKKLELSQYKERLILQAHRARKDGSAKKHRHRKTGSFWENNFAFVSKVFSKDEEGTRGNDNHRREHPLLS